MWIQTQNKQRLVNSDQIINIFISNKGTVIYAQTTAIVGMKECELIALGEYKDRGTCMKILGALSLIGTNIPLMNMPLEGEIETWIKDAADLTRDYIANDFK